MSEPRPEPEIPTGPQPQPKKVSRRQMLMTVGIALNAIAGVLFAVPVIGYILGPAKRKDDKKRIGVDNARSPHPIPRRRDPAGDLSQSICPALGWRYRQYPLLGAADFSRQVPGLRHQLHTPGLSRPVVPAIRIVHVSVSRGSLLCRTARGLPGLRRGVCSNTSYKIEQGQLWIKAGQVPTLASPPSQACADQPRKCSCA